MNRVLEWSTPLPVETVLSRIRDDLALPTEAKLLTHTYFVRAAGPGYLSLSFGKTLGDSFVMDIIGRDSLDGTSTGTVNIPSFVLIDGMPSHVEKMTALRHRVSTVIRQSGGSIR